jgi:hypothetical protein
MTLYIDTRPTLEWVEYNGRHMAHGYEIKQTPNGRWILMWTIDNHHYHDTIDQAKAAAQADYDRRTAERFRKVEVPSILTENITNFRKGYNTAIDALMEAILVAHNPRSRGMIDSVTKATLPESLHTKP